MAIFNSLGSNYSLKFALQTLLAADNPAYRTKLINYLGRRYIGKAFLFYKGRHAITCALQALKLPQDSLVGITGFTCFAVYEAVTKAGLQPFYLDINESLNFSSESLEGRNLKCVIVQNTLGYPCPITEISDYCRSNNIYLIEDLAHSIGGSYSSGLEMGTVGDMTVLSFSQDKVIDAISGGGLIIRTESIPFEQPQLTRLVSSVQLKDRLYPLFTIIIRATYSISIGKALHSLLKKLRLLSKPVDLVSDGVCELPSWYCKQILSNYQALNDLLAHRKKIARIYHGALPEAIKLTSLSISDSSNLRYPIRIANNRDQLMTLLKQNQFHLSDIWYDAPIGPKKYLARTNYTNQCPKAQKISDQIVNLPTHQNITVKHAQILSDIINQWHSTQLKK